MFGKEIRPIPEYPGYWVTSHGDVYSAMRGQLVLRKAFPEGLGYMAIKMWNNGKKLGKKVHRLVLSAFVGPCPNGMECDHIDGNPSNNDISNLQWITHQENHDRSIRMNGSRAQAGELNGAAVLTERDVAEIRQLYWECGVKQRPLARAWKVCQYTIGAAVSGKTWKHMPIRGER